MTEQERLALIDFVERAVKREPVPGGFSPEEVEALTRKLLDFSLSALQAKPDVPDSWKLVPIEPTQAMLAAFNDSDYGRRSLRERYIGMLAAALTPGGELD